MKRRSRAYRERVENAARARESKKKGEEAPDPDPTTTTEAAASTGAAASSRTKPPHSSTQPHPHSTPTPQVKKTQLPELIRSVMEGDEGRATVLLARGGDPKVTVPSNRRGSWCLVALAALWGRGHLLPCLLGAGLSVEGRGSDDRTPLMLAAWQGHTRTVQDLLTLGADPLAADKADGNGSIRLLGVSRSKTPVQAWCHIWFSPEDPPHPVRVANIDYLDYQSRNSGRQMPFLLRCPLHPNTTNVPLAVSLTGKPCAEATNLLRVVGGGKRAALVSKSKWMPVEPTSLAKMWVPAVCGPALYYYHEDFSVRLVEWLELLRAQGFNQVFLYVTDVHPNITLVLRHYVQEGFVQITDYTYPPPYVNEPSLRRLWTLVEREKMFAQENVYFTDCVLRHMHQYRFIAHFDTDEVPILPKHDSFPLFLEDVTNSRKHDSPPGYRLLGHYFYENLEPSQEAKDLPKYLWALRHTKRQAKPNEPPTPGQFKPVFDMNAVRGVFSHGTLLCVSGTCRLSKMATVSSDKAFLAHFRLTCDEQCRENTVHDLTLQRYKEKVSNRVEKVLNDLNLLK